MANNKRIISRNWPRYVLQWGVLAAIVLFLTGLVKCADGVDPETYCPMGGLQAFTTYLVRGSLPCSMSSVQIMMGLALAAGVILFSKLFCAYVCPVGTVEDLLKKLRSAINFKGIIVKNGSVADKVLRIFKYVLLFWIFYSTATASELFCKNLDPYYAVATGFKGEITLWMSITTIALVVLGGMLVDNFWCRYICPLGAASNTFKFWVWLVVLFGAHFLLGLCGVNVPWWITLGIFCLMGYLLEILCGRPKFQILYVRKNEALCNHCGNCSRECPYHIPIDSFRGTVNSVDCTLCGDCVASCRKDALHVGMCPGRPKTFCSVILPACLAVVLALAAFFVGRSYELPTIDEKWGIYSNDSLHTQLVDPAVLETVTLDGLSQIHCYGSSMAFKAKLERIKGVYGVKTFVKSHKATILYDPAKTTPEKISEEIYVPSSYKCKDPDFRAVPELRVLTIRTEHMPASTDLNFLGIQFMQADSLIYGVDSQWDCPLIVHMYVDPAFDKDEEWIRSIVEKPTLELPRHDGTVKSTPLGPDGKGFDFVRLEPEEGRTATTEFLEKMFSRPFTAQFPSRVEEYRDQPQFVYEIADALFAKPLFVRNLPFVSNHLSANDGIIGVYTRLNSDYVPALMIRYAAPMTQERIWELLTMPQWTITYSKDDIRTVDAKIQFRKPGVNYPYDDASPAHAEEEGKE